MKGFFVVKKDGKYYKSKDEYTSNVDEAYVFMLRYAANNLANLINGEVVWL